MSWHAPFAASRSHQWFRCGASAVIDTSRVKKRPKPAADHGTRLHSIAEKCLTTGKDPLFVAKSLSTDDLRSVGTYVDYVRSLDARYLALEIPVKIHPLCGGTVDCAAVTDGWETLEVVDYKSGRWEVDPHENTQLLIYSAGVLRALGHVLDVVGTVRMTIVQPAISGEPVVWEQTADQVEDWERRIVARIERIMSGDAEFEPSDEACEWCEGRTICPAFNSSGMDAARRQFAALPVEEAERLERAGELITRDAAELALSDRLELAQLARQWAQTQESEAKKILLEDGDSIPGWKVVEGQRRRAWKGRGATRRAERYLTRHGVEKKDIYGEPPFPSPSQAERLFSGKGSGALREGLAKFVKWNPGPPTIARESDARPAMNRADLARRDFEGEPIEE